MSISLEGLNKADVLAALYNASRPQGMGFLSYDPKPMTRAEAEGLLAQTTYFDYLKGRVMKSNLSGDTFDPRLYDRDNGEGTAAKVVDDLRRVGEVNSASVQETHKSGRRAAASETMVRLGDKTTFKDGMMHLGLDDVADDLGAAINAADND